MPVSSMERDGTSSSQAGPAGPDAHGPIGGVGVVIQETKNKEMEIIQIVPGGPAHVSGIVRIGDMVESVDGLFVSGVIP